jgi:uncharacterized protein YegL
MSTTVTGEAILPFYIMCDESGSMDANGGIDAINQGLPELHATICADPLVTDKCRIGLITFSDYAEELLPLSKMSDVTAMPGCTAKGLTNYGEAFNLLRSAISRDIADLKSQGYQVYRPAVFFITDGEPTDEWEMDYRALVDKNANRQAPNVIAFGVGGSDPHTIGRVGTVGAFVMRNGHSPGNALKEIMRSLTNSIVSSSGQANPTLVVPDAPDGCVSVPLDPMI